MKYLIKKQLTDQPTDNAINQEVDSGSYHTTSLPNNTASSAAGSARTPRFQDVTTHRHIEANANATTTANQPRPRNEVMALTSQDNNGTSLAWIIAMALGSQPLYVTAIGSSQLTSANDYKYDEAMEVKVNKFWLLRHITSPPPERLVTSHISLSREAQTVSPACI